MGTFSGFSIRLTLCSVDVETKQVEMSFRSFDPQRNNHQGIKLSDLSEGSKVDAVVKKIEDYGLFLEIESSKVRGLCHKSEVRISSRNRTR